MTKKQHLANLKSAVLDHWNVNLRMAKERRYDLISLAGLNCPYCQEFSSDNCIGCPVKRITRRPDCSNTPYVLVTRLQLCAEFPLSGIADKEKNVHQRLIQAIKDEIAFLERT
jgi:hypothetical protein